MPTFQHDKHAVHCVLGSVSSNSNNSMLPTSWIIESILERWYSAHASQQNVVTLEFGSPCSPRSPLFAHDSKCHDQQRVSPFFHEVFCLQRWNVSLSWKKKIFVFENYLAHFVCVCFNNGSPRSFWRNTFFVKRIDIDLLRTRRFSSILHSSRVIPHNGSLRSLTIWI